MKLIRLALRKVKDDFLETWFYILLLLILNIVIMTNYIGYAPDGVNETLILYFMGSNSINTSFFMWIFLQTCIIGFSIHKINIDINNSIGFYILKFKNVSGYVLLLLMRMIVDVVIYNFFLYFGIYIYLRLFYKALRTIHTFQSFINFDIKNVILILMGTGIFNTIIFVLLICIIGIFIKSLSNSYFILQIYQLFFLFFSDTLGVLFKYIPLIHSVFVLYDNLNVLFISFIYQLILIIFLSTVILILVNIKIEELI